MRIGELSRRTGCKVETIRYYERIGLMPEPPRRGKYRNYGPDDAERLKFILHARTLDFSLDEARSLIRLARSPAEGCPNARALAKQHLLELRSRISGLQSIERSLASAVEACGIGDGCAVIAQVNAGEPVPADFLTL